MRLIPRCRTIAFKCSSEVRHGSEPNGSGADMADIDMYEVSK